VPKLPKTTRFIIKLPYCLPLLIALLRHPLEKNVVKSTARLENVVASLPGVEIHGDLRM
jgi:hypothetical protein